MGRGTKTTEFLKLCLSDAFVELLNEKPFESITVDEIAAAAGVSRATYFRNFNSKEELISFKLDVLLKKMFSKHKNMDMDEGIKLVLNFYYTNREFILTVCKDKKGAEILDSVQKRLFPQLMDTLTDYQTAFYLCGLLGVFEKWFRSGCVESPDEMMKIHYTIENNVVELISRTYTAVEINSETGMPEFLLKLKDA